MKKRINNLGFYKNRTLKMKNSNSSSRMLTTKTIVTINRIQDTITTATVIKIEE